MAADPELRELALSIVNGLTDINEQPEPPDRVAFVRTLIWNFFYGANGRLAKEKVDAQTFQVPAPENCPACAKVRHKAAKGEHYGCAWHPDEVPHG